jgi:O-6-methylguanine DNA methyltransferase
VTEESIHIDWLESPLGILLVGATDRAVCLLEFSSPDQRATRTVKLEQRYSRILSPGSSPLLVALRDQLTEYFAGNRRSFDLPLSYGGTPFQNSVWTALREIPYGETWSYGEVANRIGDRDASRAVGAANGLNPIAIVVPCHRVINADGTPGGFGGGIRRKQILLDLERGQLQLRI